VQDSSTQTVVKCCLLKHLRAGSRERLHAAIQLRVDRYSRRVDLASLALMGLLKEHFHGVTDFQACGAPVGLFHKTTGQTFMRQLLVGTAQASKPVPTVRAFYERHPELLQGDTSLPNSGNIWTEGAKVMLTCLKNSLRTNLVRRMGSFARAYAQAHGLDKSAVALLRCALVWGPDSEQVVARFQQATDKAQGAGAAAPQEQEGDEAGSPPQPAHLANMLRVATAHRPWLCARGHRRASTQPGERVPPRGQQAVQAPGAHPGVLCLPAAGAGGAAGAAVQPVSAVQAQAAPHPDRHLLPVRHRARCRVGGQHLQRGNLFTVAMEAPGGGGRYQSLRLSRSQHLGDSGQLRARARTQKWHEGIRAPLAALSEVSPKGLDLASHEAYVALYLKVREALWAEHSKSRWARQRMRLYGGKRRAMDRFTNRLGRACKRADPARQRVVVAYGAASFPANAKREPSVPVKWARQQLARRFEVHLVDEFRSSRVSSTTGTLLKAAWSRKDEKRIRGLLWCDSTTPGVTSKLVDRDVNAAINIRRCFLAERQGGARPATLCRTACKGACLPRQAPIGRRLPR
jgi:hypothetical protein